jgi:hypothetical protein
MHRSQDPAPHDLLDDANAHTSAPASHTLCAPEAFTQALLRFPTSPLTGLVPKSACPPPPCTTHLHAQLSAPAHRLLASPPRAAPVCCTIPCIAMSRALRFTRTSSPFRASLLVSCATHPRRRASPAPRTPYICLYFTLCAHPFIGHDVCRSSASASISIVVFYLHRPRMFLFYFKYSPLNVTCVPHLVFHSVNMSVSGARAVLEICGWRLTSRASAQCD